MSRVEEQFCLRGLGPYFQYVEVRGSFLFLFSFQD